MVSISTIMYAPKFCSLYVPDNIVDWKPPSGFDNKKEVVETANKAIMAMNKEDNINFLNLHYEGIRIDKKSGKKIICAYVLLVGSV